MTEWILKEKINGWTVMSGLRTFNWVAWAAHEPMRGRDTVDKPGTVYREFGRSREEAIGKLMARLLSRS